MPKKPIQVVLIGGGATFKTQAKYYQDLKTSKVSLDKPIKWNYEYLDQALGKNYEVIRPRMPMADNAYYKDWKIVFEKYLKLLDKNYILIGFSLGGVFLAKFLAEKNLKLKPRKVILVAAPYDGAGAEEELTNGFKITGSLIKFEKNCQDIIFYFSANDPIITPDQIEKYQQKLRLSQIKIFKNKNGHFQTNTFPELIKKIKE